jgi:predicted O-linked N-acetylglucosamine transferase (SPINDLY family)
MSAPYIDYILADNVLIPPQSVGHYSEKIVYLPGYQVNDRKRVISDKVFTRLELGLPEQGIVYCCFNNNYKILPATFNSWMNILKAVEGSVLFLYADLELTQQNLRKEAINRGVDPNRLIFGKRLLADEYLARYKAADLFLDTLPFNAGTTGSDALWAGLPVLTLLGSTFAGRYAASLLTAIGLPELITKTQAEYEALAVELGKHPEKLTAIKEKLAQNRQTTPLFDTPLFTKNLEAAYTQMMERYWADLGPENIIAKTLNH